MIENQKPGPTFQTKKWQYDLVEVIEMGTTKFASLLQDYENRGWDYHGTTQLTHDKKMVHPRSAYLLVEVARSVMLATVLDSILSPQIPSQTCEGDLWRKNAKDQKQRQIVDKYAHPG